MLGLIGYRGSGKTTVGRILAQSLGRSFVDVDEYLVNRAGKTIREIFAEQGEQAFRDLETAAIADLCRLQSAVISFGGGALDRGENRQAIADAGIHLVYLRCDPTELLRRIESDPLTAANRPNLTSLGGGIAEIQAVLARREPLWRTMLKDELDVTRLMPDEVAGQIAAGFRPRHPNATKTRLRDKSA